MVRKVKDQELKEIVVSMRRHSRTVKGGRIMSSAALVIVGDQEGKVGFGRGKSKDAMSAIKKATSSAHKSMTKVFLSNGHTVWHSIQCSLGATKVFIAPAAPGTGIIAGGAMRSVFEAVGIKDVLAKIYGSTNPHNVVRATVLALQKIKDARYYAHKRNIPVTSLITANAKD